MPFGPEDGIDYYLLAMARGLDTAGEPEAQAFEELSEAWRKKSDTFAADFLLELQRMLPYNGDVALQMVQALVVTARRGFLENNPVEDTESGVKTIIEDLEDLQLIDLTWQDAREARKVIDRAIDELRRIQQGTSQTTNNPEG
jgi:hypothetical protein